MTPEEIRKQMMGSASVGGGERQESADEPVVLTITTENTETQPATAENIRTAVWDDSVRGEFLVLENGDGAYFADGEEDAYYMQAGTISGSSLSAEGFRLEYRHGDAAQHFAAGAPVMCEELERALLKYLRGDQSFEQDFKWEPAL